MAQLIVLYLRFIHYTFYSTRIELPYICFNLNLKHDKGLVLFQTVYLNEPQAKFYRLFAFHFKIPEPINNTEKLLHTLEEILKWFQESTISGRQLQSVK